MASIDVFPEDAEVTLRTRAPGSEETETSTFSSRGSIRVPMGSTVGYYVTREGYYPQEGTIEVNKDTQFRITLLKKTAVKQRITLRTEQKDSTITIYNALGDVLSTGTNGMAFADVQAGDFISYVASAPGYSKTKGSLTVYYATTKTITLREGAGEIMTLDVTVKPKGTYVKESPSVTTTSNTLSNVQLTPRKNLFWEAHPSTTQATFTYLNVIVYGENGKPIIDKIPIYNEETGEIIGYQEVIRKRDVWVEENLGEYEDLNADFGITYEGTPSYDDIIYVEMPLNQGIWNIAKVRFQYPATIQLTSINKDTGLSNFVLDKTKSYWLSRTEPGDATFSRVETMKRDSAGNIVYHEVTIHVEGGTDSTELQPVMIEKWVEANAGELENDSDLDTIYGITFTGTPVVGDTFTIGYLPALDVTKDVDDNGFTQIETDYSVYPDITYTASLVNYNCWETGEDYETGTISMAVDRTPGTYGNFGLYEGQNQSIIAALHYKPNVIAFDSVENGKSYPGVYNLDAAHIPESYPSKCLWYEMLGSGAGGTGKVDSYRTKGHHGWHTHHTWHYVASGATGGTGAYVKGCIKGICAPENFMVSVGYPGLGSRNGNSDTLYGSPTGLSINEASISVAGGDPGKAPSATYTQQRRFWHWRSSSWGLGHLTFGYTKGSLTIAGASEGAGGLVTFVNLEGMTNDLSPEPDYSNYTIKPGNNGKCGAGEYNINLSNVPAPETIYGYGGGVYIEASSHNNIVPRDGGPGYARIIINDNDEDMDDLITNHK